MPADSRAQVRIAASLEAMADATVVGLHCRLTLRDRLIKAQYKSLKLYRGNNTAEAILDVDEPELWYPNGYGHQPLYNLECILTDSTGCKLDSKTVTIGLRKIEWVQNENAPEGSLNYLVKANDKQILIKGWNWTPVRQLYGREHREVYERRLELARDANCTLLRVWGGGLAERKIFYDLCDQYGILVWQELFQSSSCMDSHPSDEPAFAALLSGQIEQIIPEYRNHACPALWCGGNELCYRGDAIDANGKILQHPGAL